jgi:hypothetical protein
MLKLIQLVQSAYGHNEVIKYWYFLLDTDHKTFSPLGYHAPDDEFLKRLILALDERIGFKHLKIEITETEFYKLLTELEYKNVTP